MLSVFAALCAKGRGAQPVGKHLRFKSRVIGGVYVAVNEFARLCLAVQRHRKNGRQVEVQRFEVRRVVLDERRARRRKVVALVAGGIGIRLPVLGMLGTDAVDAARLIKREVVAVAVVRFDEFEHVLLRERREHQAELHFVGAVDGTEQHVKFRIAHFGELRARAHRLARTLFQLLFAAFDRLFDLVLVQLVRMRGLARKAQVGRGFVAVIQARIVPVEGRGLGDGRGQRLRVVHRTGCSRPNRARTSSNG